MVTIVVSSVDVATSLDPTVAVVPTHMIALLRLFDECGLHLDQCLGGTVRGEAGQASHSQGANGEGQKGRFPPTFAVPIPLGVLCHQPNLLITHVGTGHLERTPSNFGLSSSIRVRGWSQTAATVFLKLLHSMIQRNDKKRMEMVCFVLNTSHSWVAQLDGEDWTASAYPPHQSPKPLEHPTLFNLKLKMLRTSLYIHKLHKTIGNMCVEVLVHLHFEMVLFQDLWLRPSKEAFPKSKSWGYKNRFIEWDASSLLLSESIGLVCIDNYQYKIHQIFSGIIFTKLYQNCILILRCPWHVLFLASEVALRRGTGHVHGFAASMRISSACKLSTWTKR